MVYSLWPRPPRPAVLERAESKSPDSKDFRAMENTLQPTGNTNAHMVIAAISLGRLGNLPAEIRVMIYKLVLRPEYERSPGSRWVFMRRTGHPPTFRKPRVPNIVAVSRMIRRETVPLYYDGRELLFSVDCENLRSALKQLHTLAENFRNSDLTAMLQSMAITIELTCHDYGHCSYDTVLAAAEITQLFCALGAKGIVRYCTSVPVQRWLPNCLFVARVLGYMAFQRSWPADQLSQNIRLARRNETSTIVYTPLDDLPEVLLRLPREPNDSYRYLMLRNAGAGCKNWILGGLVKCDGTIFRINNVAQFGTIEGVGGEYVFETCGCGRCKHR